MSLGGILRKASKAVVDDVRGVVAALREYKHAVCVARADPIEALHRHYCGPGCWHYEDATPAERKDLLVLLGAVEWPSEVMKRYHQRKQ